MAAGAPCETLFIGDLPDDITQESLNEIFGAYGTVTDIKVLGAKGPGSKPSAIVKFSTVQEAQWFQENVNGNCPQGLTTAIVVKYNKDNKPVSGGKGGAAVGAGANWVAGKDGWKGGGGFGQQSAKGGWKGGGDFGQQSAKGSWKGGGDFGQQSAKGSWKGGGDVGQQSAKGSWKGGGAGKFASGGAAGGKGWEDEAPSDQVYIGDMPHETDDALVLSIFGKYGDVTWSKAFPSKQPGDKSFCLVQFGSVDEAKWLVENVNGNVPEGLTSPVTVRFKAYRGGGSGRKGGDAWGGAGAAGPYGGGKGGAKAGGCDIAMVVKGISKGRPRTPEENQLRVTGLPANTTDVDLYKLFGPFGALLDVKTMVSQDGSCTGIGWIDFNELSQAEEAISTLNGTILPDGTSLGVAQKRAGGGKGKGKDSQ